MGFGGMPARSRPNPAHGPILRGLHRKPPIDPPSQGSKEADLFLKKMAAELPIFLALGSAWRHVCCLRLTAGFAKLIYRSSGIVVDVTDCMEQHTLYLSYIAHALFRFF